jgi:hypothetical protein
MELPYLYSLLPGPKFSASPALLVSFSFGILAFGLLYLLWRFPLTVANKLLDSSAREPVEPASPDLWLALGCSLIGLWLLSSYVLSLIQTLTMLWNISEYDYPVFIFNLAYDLTAVALGLWLVLGARGFRKVFWWARYAGRGRIENSL